DWAVSTLDGPRRAWILAVARRADPDPAWRDRFRDASTWTDRAAFEKLAAEARVAELSPSLVVGLAERLRTTGGDGLALLRRAQARNPADFWLNVELAHACKANGQEDDALAYYRVALALRPGDRVTLGNVGNALLARGRVDEAIDHYRQALQPDGKYAIAHYNLGTVLSARGQLD